MHRPPPRMKVKTAIYESSRSKMALANQVDHKFAISVLQVTLVTAGVLSQLIAKRVSQENTAALKPAHVLIVCQESTAALALNFVLTVRQATRRQLAKHSA